MSVRGDRGRDAKWIWVLAAYIAMFCKALGASYGDVAISIVVPAAFLRRHRPSLGGEHGGRSPTIMLASMLDV